MLLALIQVGGKARDKSLRIPGTEKDSSHGCASSLIDKHGFACASLRSEHA
jgi:hypothetical protein